MNIRVGFGYDVHRLEAGLDFLLGGVKIEHTKGAVGHSDADVLIHAICDALLGAANMQDIGYHFSDKDPKLKGIDSKILLEKVVGMLKFKGYNIGNIDSTVSLQKPKIAPFIPEMKTTLAGVMQIDEDQISIKATTTEKLGFEGREEGVSAYAVVLITKSPD
jgi:2-C-methyl-D-erythritol 2,4-cyclodiphosphate synthase